MGRLPPLPRQSLSGLPEPSPDVPASPPCPPRPRPTLPSAPARPEPFSGHPGAPRWASSGPRAGSAGADPERAARVPGCGASPRLCARGGQGAAAPRTCQASSQDRRRRRNFRSPCRWGARPLSREGGRGSRGEGWGAQAALAPSHALRPAPGRGRTAPPPAPAHRLTPALTHTHTPSRALTRTPLPPPALFISSSCLGTQEKPSTAPAPRSLRPRPAPHSGRYATEGAPGRSQNGEPGSPPLAPGQRLLPAAPTNLLVGEPRTVATNPLCRSPDRQPVGGRESRTKPWSILGVVVFPLS